MPYDYGEIGKTKGTDSKPVNVIVGPFITSGKIFVCQMSKKYSGEDKCLIGFLDRQSAKKAFISCYGGDVKFLQQIKGVSIKKFKKLLISRRGLSLLAHQEYDLTTILNVVQPVPTGWNTKVENPGDRKITKKERAFNTELARRQGGAPSYATVAQTSQFNDVSPDWIYSENK